MEREVDAMVQARLARDDDYLSAENAEEQAAREQVVSDEEVARWTEKNGDPTPFEEAGQ